MERIQFQRKLKELPLPCDYFDMIGGTSTGGSVVTTFLMLNDPAHLLSRLIALMLGRLRMSVTDAIEYYGIVSEKVFSDMKSSVGQEKFKTSKLENVIKEITEKQTGHADECMMDMHEGDACKTYVKNGLHVLDD